MNRLFAWRQFTLFVSFNFCIFLLLIIKLKHFTTIMREALSLPSIYKKFQSLEQKKILKFELKLENNEVRLLNFVFT